ncbi:MAG: GatB/YqeY domain-containing protein [Candidatus Cloacimonetes bacterium]|nr:GatB/YqeY domain-containing protein [Candidatus Cloacimonadota bacterium]
MINRLAEEIKQAMRDKDAKRLLVLRSLKAALMNLKVELMQEPTEEQSLEALFKAVKTREQAIELYEKAGRTELAETEKAEILIIQEFLPKMLTDDELKAEVAQACTELEAMSMKDMGRVMKHLNEKLGNRADGKALSTLVRAKLSN